MSNNKITICPFCKGESGYYEKLIVSYAQYYTYTHESDGTSEFQHMRGGENIYCIDCNRDITKKIERPE